VPKKKVKFCCPVKYVNIHIFSHLTWLSQKTVGDGEKLFTYLNSALKVLLGTDICLRVPKKKVKFCCPVKYVNIHIFSHLTWLSQKTVGDGEKLLTYLNSALNVLLGTDILLHVPKRMLNLVAQCNVIYRTVYHT
jgi:hypothetical protein